MGEFFYNCYINEASKHSPFEVSYDFQPATHVDRLLPLTGAPDPDSWLEMFVRELLTLSMQLMAARSYRPTPIFVVGDFVFISYKGLHIHS